MNAPTVWCPSCGAEYVAGSRYCSDCRVELVVEPARTRPAPLTDRERDGLAPNDDPNDLSDDRDDDNDGDGDDDLVEIGSWPRLQAQILRRRLETAGMSVMVEWSGPGPDAEGTILVPEAQAEFSEAVVNELDVDDEIPDTSPEAYIERIEEHLSAIGALLDELRTGLDQTT
jgi:hypothetical protein